MKKITIHHTTKSGLPKMKLSELRTKRRAYEERMVKDHEESKKRVEAGLERTYSWDETFGEPMGD